MRARVVEAKAVSATAKKTAHKSSSAAQISGNRLPSSIKDQHLLCF
jgi:hypothetical protein